MKVSRFLLVVLVFLLSGEAPAQKKDKKQKIDTREKYEKIIVGMTYDDVKKVLGNPPQIIRGFTKVERNEIVERGQLKYVTWLYPKISRDTTFRVLFDYKKAVESIEQHTFYINNIEVTPNEYNSLKVDRAGNIRFFSHLGGQHEVDRINWREVARTFLHEKEIVRLVESGKPFTMKDSVHLSPITKDVPIDGTLGSKPVLVVTYLWAIYFDASSGLVVDMGYLPVEVKKLYPTGYVYED